MNLQKILSQATLRLEQAKIDTPRLDAEILLAHVLNCQRLKLYTDSEKILSSEEIERFENLISQREKKIPVAYLIRKKEFMGLNFFVDENVLIPRPETEILAQIVIENLSGEKIFVDLGTGSGAICISVCKFLKTARAFAVDISENALKIAKLNAEKFFVDDRINFFCGNLFEPLAEKKFDAVVSRAVASLDKLIKYAEKCVKSEGYFVAFKSKLLAEELDNAKQVLKRSNLQLIDTIEYELPTEEKHVRKLVVFKHS